MFCKLTKKQTTFLYVSAFHYPMKCLCKRFFARLGPKSCLNFKILRKIEIYTC